jgi:hypothetical protein
MFTLNQLALTISKSGNGAGTVTSNPAGITCGSSCAANFNFGQMVTLTAAASAGSTFAGWSGGNCTGTGSCVGTVSSSVTITANFNASSSLTCTTVTTANSCTNATISEINLGPMAGAACHDQCQVQLAAAGVTTGCWIVALDTNCYCRGGTLNLGGSRPGGACN